MMLVVAFHLQRQQQIEKQKQKQSRQTTFLEKQV